MTGGERRSARLLFGEEIALGELDPQDLEREEVVHAVREMALPSGIARRLQVRALARGHLTYTRDVVAPMTAARAAVLGPRAVGRPRVLLRLDAFPGDGIPPETLTGVHGVLRDAQVPYLLTLDAPRLDLGDQFTLRTLYDDGVRFALRAPLDGDPGAALDAAVAGLRERALRADVLAPAPGTLRMDDWAAAAQRFDVVAGGPEDVRRVGFHATPLWRGDAVWLPAYAPLAGAPSEVAAGVAELAERQTAIWAPAVVALAALAADRAALEGLAATLAGNARSWDEFLAAVRASRDAA